jgi:hypothetical protein
LIQKSEREALLKLDRQRKKEKGKRMKLFTKEEESRARAAIAEAIRQIPVTPEERMSSI